MNILVAGATGFIGSHLVRSLEKEGYHVISLTRRYGYDFKNLRQVDDWLPLLNNVDSVINTVGIIAPTKQSSFQEIHYQAPSALFKACVIKKIKRVIQISALGADDGATSAFLLSKKAADDELKLTQLDWFILRPSIVYGEGGVSDQLFHKLAGMPVIAVMDKGQQLIQPIHVNDVVATIMQCLKSKKTQLIIDVVGTKIISFLQWLQQIRKSQGKAPAYIIKLPFYGLFALSHIAQYISPLLRPDNIKMLRQSNTADVIPLVKFIGYEPKRMEEIR